MVAANSRLRLKHEEIVAKVLDGEAVVIDLSNGAYYTTDTVGGAIWSMFENGLSVAEITSALTECYEVAAARAQADVSRMATEIVDAGLMDMADLERMPTQTPRDAGAQKLPYDTPRLTAFHDMEELLALDPPTPSLSDISWKG